MDFLNFQNEEDKDLSTLSREELQELAKSYGITDEPIKVVEIDSLVVLKIIKHCLEAQSTNETPTGTLLGLDVGSTLHITNSFPLPSPSSSSSNPSSANSSTPASQNPSSNSNLDFQTQTMLLLRDVSLDYSTVGWYTSSTFGYLPEALIPHQIHFQSSIPKSLFLIFDPLKYSHGVLSLQAYRLHSSFIQGYNGMGWNSASIAERVFERVEVKVKGIGAGGKGGVGGGIGVWERMGVGSRGEGERGVENVVEGMERLVREQVQYYYRKRREGRGEGAAEGGNNEGAAEGGNEGGGVEGRMMRGQVERFCNEVVDYGNDSVIKLYLAQNLILGKK
eukprot:TRINITY_DN14979_c0_g1_i1.p1 TRINITY_DN14979_c0_g1~~TRINITY_DN14979_c0_g1_i1.p1  ORF type:complete len:335 (-),score=143.91 TRINITY_DN14979_c0_g1_i1:129-1133(-)